MNKERLTMKIALDPGAFVPERAHDTDAGLDLRTPDGVLVPADGSVVIDTGVHVELPHGYYGKVESKSGLNVRQGIVSCGGIIDDGYTGSIVVKLYNFSGKKYIFAPGDKIAQLVVQPYAAPEMYLVSLNEFAETERGSGGFGSTGR